MKPNNEAGHDHDHPHDDDHHVLPETVAVAGEGTGFEYLYRRGELLTTTTDARRVAMALRGLAGDATEREDLKAIGLVRFHVPELVDIPRLVRTLRESLSERPVSVSPNHVLFFPSHIKWVAGSKPPVPAPPRSLPMGSDLPGCGIKVGVVDTGVVSTHPWLQGRVDAGPGDEEVLDADGDGELDLDAGHGTFVSGLILEVAPAATVIMRRAESETGVTDEITVASAITQLIGVDVLNLSLGGYCEGDAPPLALVGALQQVWRKRPDTVVVAGAGNDGWERPFYPAALKGVIAVGATDSRKRAAAFSNRGWWLDACTTGEDVDSSFVEWDQFKGWATWSGTSFAAARVSGAIAAMCGTAGDPASAAYALTGAPGLRQVANLGAFVPCHVVT